MPNGGSVLVPARITLSSTSGLCRGSSSSPPEPVGFRLAISLHGATTPCGSESLPINKRWPLEELLPAVQTFPRSTAAW